jgi:SAM-dependent methyltransferase
MSTAPATMQPADWSGTAGARWAENVDHFEKMLAPPGEALLDWCGFSAGERVVEIGCGGGGLTRAIAARVAPGGGVLGLDISEGLVALATERAAAGGIDNAAFLAGDAQRTIPEQAPFDRLVSRFGVMFFADPAAAMANLRAMIAPGGRLDFAVWAPAEFNPQFVATGMVAREYLGLAPADPRGPGPLAFSDTAYLEGLLTGAGFGAVSFGNWRGTLPFAPAGMALADAAELMLRTSAIADAMREAGPGVHEAARAALADRLAEYHGPAGLLLPAQVHLVRATA